MKGRNLIFTALLAIAVGIILIITKQSVHSTGVVTTGGILFILAGVVNMVVFESGRRRNKQGRGAIAATFSWLTSAAAVILGACMLFFKDTFVPLVPVMFGILVAFCALYQFYILAIGARPMLLPGWLYLFPVALAGGATYIFMQQPENSDLRIMLATGISLAVFGLGCLIEGSTLGALHRKALRDTAKADETTATADSPKTLDSTPDHSESEAKTAEAESGEKNA